MMYDVIIIGTGISGAMAARELSRYRLKVLLLDKDNDICNETTAANSAIVHSGYDPEPGTNKQKYNVLGNQMYDRICKQLDVEYKPIGSITVALDEEDMATLYQLKERAAINQVPVQILSKQEVLALEPNLNPNLVGGLLAPTAGIVYPFELCVAAVENAMDNGVELKLNQRVIDITKQTQAGQEYFELKTESDVFQTKTVVNCAGMYADRINDMISNQGFRIIPRRGEYLLTDKSVGDFVKHIIFPCPSSKGKGVLLVPTVHGNLMMGPTSDVIADKEDNSTTMAGIDYVRQKLSQLAVNLPFDRVIRTFSGLRASADGHDFIIEEAADAAGFFNVAGIESPGLASSPAIAQQVVRLVGQRLRLVEKSDFIEHRRKHIEFAKLSTDEKIKLIEQDKNYGKMVCRCEGITKAEVLDCIHRNAGATTIKGVKKRVRPGMGICQGGFCGPEILEILAEELKIDRMAVQYDELGSNVLVEETKIRSGGEQNEQAKGE